jgi:hypothetical protein
MMTEDHNAFALHCLDLLLGGWPLTHRNQVRSRDASCLVFTWFSAIEKVDRSSLIVDRCVEPLLGYLDIDFHLGLSLVAGVETANR